MESLLGRQGSKNNDERDRKKADEKVRVRLVCCSLILGYNRLKSL
jgi:hypothetical protein